MRDFVSFVLRGAWGGAIFILLVLTLFYGPRGPLFFLNPLALAYYVLPGTIVGLVLWILAGRITQPLVWGLRFAIGTGVVAAILFLLNFYELVSEIKRIEFLQVDVSRVLQGVEWTLILASGFGGFAGLACPSIREVRDYDAQLLTYRQRVRMYEAAEEEARLARQRIALSKRNEG